jgi:putative membrane protein
MNFIFFINFKHPTMNTFLTLTKKKSMPIACLAIMALFVYSCDSNPNQQNSTEVAEEANEETFEETGSSNVMEEGSEFLVDAASGGMMEVEAGKLALNKASSPQVKEFAQRMVDEHSQANQKLMDMAETKNITLPNSMSDKHQEKVEGLTEAADADFDREYMDLMDESHMETIEMYEEASENANDTDIRAFATETLPTLRNHHQEAESMKETIGN